MNIHENARTTPASRDLLVRRVLEQGWSARQAAGAAGISCRTAYKWLRRYADEGGAGPVGQPHAARGSAAVPDSLLRARAAG